MKAHHLTNADFETQYAKYFKRNRPEKKIKEEIDNIMKNRWTRFVDINSQQDTSLDFQDTGCNWLRKSYPGEGTGESAKVFTGPQSKILILNCKTEDLHSSTDLS